MNSTSQAVPMSKESNNSIQHFLADTFQEAKSHINDGLNALKKDLVEFSEATYDLFSLPVNNFLKNIDQIERDFLNGLEKTLKQPALHIVSAEHALLNTMQLEENY